MSEFTDILEIEHEKILDEIKKVKESVGKTDEAFEEYKKKVERR